MTGRADNKGRIHLGLLILGLMLLGVSHAVYELRSLGATSGADEPGTVRVEAEPASSIYLDAQFLGVSPIQFRVPEGEHLLEARAPGYEPSSRILSSSGGSPELIRLQLKPEPRGKIEITSEPTGARIYLDDFFAGYSPLTAEISAGSHIIRVQKPNHYAFQTQVQITPGDNPPLEVKLRDRVLEFLLAAVETAPESVAHHTDLAHYYFVNDELKKSADAYRRALEASCRPDADDEEVKRLNKELKKHLRWPGKELTEFRELIKEAEEQVRAKYPGNVRLLRERSLELERRHRLQDALEVWRNGAEANPANPEIHIQHARLALRLRMSKEAGQALEKAVETAGEDFELLVDAAQTAINQYRALPEDQRDVVANLITEKIARPAIEHEDLPDAQRATGWYLLARLAEDQQEYEKAVNAYREAVGLEPVARTRAEWRGRMAELLGRLGRKDEGVKVYEEALKDAQGTPQRTVMQRRLERFIQRW